MNIKRKHNKKLLLGFTLIEVLVVIAVIGILASIVLINVSGSRGKARIAKAQMESRRIYNAIFLLENDTEEWPGHQSINVLCTDPPEDCDNNELCDDGCFHKLSDGFGGLTQDDLDDPYPSWDGPYISEIPLDPWGHEYFFDTDYTMNAGTPEEKQAVVVGSYGPNEEGLNLYDEDDIFYIIISE